MRKKPASSSEGGAMRRKLLMSAAGLLVAIAPVMGHHAFGGEFDPNKPVLLKGKVTRMEWVNPHAWIHIAVVQSDGTTEEGMVEGGTPKPLLGGGIVTFPMLPRVTWEYGHTFVRVFPPNPILAQRPECGSDFFRAPIA